ncbi:MAG: hypothetical protein ABL925_04635 [Methylococcales bacterium]
MRKRKIGFKNNKLLRKKLAPKITAQLDKTRAANSRITNVKKLIVVLGMHRSGTSAITRGLKVMGVDLGERLMPPADGNNAKGFWEDIDLNVLNMEMLTALGSDWHYLMPIDAADVLSLRKQGYFLRAVQLLREKLTESPVFGLKDPRVAKLLPFWKEVFRYCQIEVRYVLAVRHPLSVAQSLLKRDGFDEEKSYLLWLGHVISSLADTIQEKRVIVDYDRLLQSTSYELHRIADALELRIVAKELQDYQASFLDKTLRHTVYDLKDLLEDFKCPPLVMDIYAVLQKLAADELADHDLSLHKQVALWVNEFERFKSCLSLTDRLALQKDMAVQVAAQKEGQIAMLNQALADKDRHVDELNSIINERNTQIAELNQAHYDRNVHIDNLSARLTENEAKIADFQQAVLDKDNHITHLNLVVSDRDAQISVLTQVTTDRDGLIGELNKAAVEQDRQIEYLNLQIGGLDQQVEQFRQALNERDELIFDLNKVIADNKYKSEQLLLSTSWRITRPLRAIKSVFKH